jgi:protocatechuate 3,4-dioxygenase beta subunit
MAIHRSPGAPAGRLVMSGPPVMTNDLGEFRLHSLAPGEYYVQATPRIGPPNAPSTPSALILAPTFYPGTTEVAAAEPITIGVGAMLGDIEIGILQVPAFSIKGIIVDEAGTPVANAAVMVSSDPLLGENFVGSPSRTRTAADGTFSIEGMASGTYRLTAAAPCQGCRRRTDEGRWRHSGQAACGTAFDQTMNGVPPVRFDSDAVSVVIQDNHVSGVQVTAKQLR